MKLYIWNIAPNPRRVCVYLIEKGIEVPMEEVGVPASRSSIRRFSKRRRTAGFPCWSSTTAR